MDAATVELAVKLLPTAISMAQQLGEIVEKARDEGYEIPGVDDLDGLTAQLRELPDLSPAKPSTGEG